MEAKTYNNWINDNSHMPEPPAWWLERLYFFDPKLVVIPSRQRPGAYILARRPTHSQGLDPVVKWMRNEHAEIPPDTMACHQHKVVPVCLMYQVGSAWSIDNILERLSAGDTWAAGGADAFVDQIEEQEVVAEKKAQRSLWENMYQRGRDAYRSYTARTGSRINPGGTLAQADRRDKGGVIQQPSTL